MAIRAEPADGRRRPECRSGSVRPAGAGPGRYTVGAERLRVLQRLAGNSAVTDLVQRDPTAVSSTTPPTAGRAAPTSDRTAAAVLEGIFKQLRTARVLLFLAGQRRSADAQRAIGTTLGQLRRLERQARGLRNRLRLSGGAAKVAAKLAEVESEIAAAKTVVEEQRAVVRAADAALRAEKAAATGLFARIKQLMSLDGIARAKAGSKLWKLVGGIVAPRINRLLAMLEASTAGARIVRALRVLKSPWVGRVLIVGAAVLEGVHAYVTSKNTTTGGRTADAVINGASQALVVANPATAAADLFLPKKYKLSTMYRGGSGAVTAIGEGLVTGDTTAMENFHEASKRGEYGKVMQLSSEAGDYWNDHGVVGGLKDFAKEFWDWL